MRIAHQYLTTKPFDVYELHLFAAVVRHASFTKAGKEAGLTQSAITRQIQGLETKLGVQLLERTTRRVRMTPAGEYLYGEATRLIGSVEESLRRLREEYAGARKEVRVGVSRGVSLAYLPGFFHANLRDRPEIGARVFSHTSAELLAKVEGNDLDLGVLSLPPRLGRGLQITHRFADAFTLIAAPAWANEYRRLAPNRRLHWLRQQNWLLLEPGTQTGRNLQRWMEQAGLEIEPTMQLDSFDLIINLVALGMGLSFVPVRALALYGKRRQVTRLPFKTTFARQLVVIARRQRVMPEHLQAFIENILF